MGNQIKGGQRRFRKFKSAGMVSQVRVYWNPKSGFRYLLDSNGFELHKHDFKIRKQKVLLDKKWKTTKNQQQTNNNGKDSTLDGHNEQLSLFVEKVIAAGKRMFPKKKTHTLIDRMTVEFIFE